MVYRKFETSVIWLFVGVIILIVFIYALFPNSFFMTGRVGGGVGLVGLTVLNPEINISILSPENTTYSFGIGDTYNISLNVTSDFVPDTWWYDLFDIRHSNYTNQSVVFTPNTTIIVNRWDNRLMVYANHSVGTIVNENVTFFVSVPNGAPILGTIDDSILICENNTLNYYFNATDLDENTLISIDINPKDPFYVDPTIFNNAQQTFVESYIISDVFTKSDIGSYLETISVSDQEYVDTKIVNITIVEINNPPVFSEIGAQTAWTIGDNNFYYALDLSDTESGNRTSGNFSFVSTFLSGNKFFDINNIGVINFTGNASIVGSYNISVCVTDRALDVVPANISYCGQDGLNQTTCKNFSLAVTSNNRPPTIVTSYPSSVGSIAGTSALYFNASYIDPDGNIPDARWYIDGVLKELVVGSSSDEFSYTFGCGVSGTHTSELVISDGLLNDSIMWSFTVANVDCPVAASGGGSGGSGGGGGGGGSRCLVEWVCNDWDVCQNIQTSLDFGIVSGRDYRSSINSCEGKGLVEDTCGIQIRDCSDLKTCNVTIGIPDEIQSCYYIEEPGCFDGVKNCHGGSCELLIDCGGSCRACSTCSDNVQNQGELGVDCGGPCPWKCVEVIPFVKKYFAVLVVLILSLLVSLTIFEVTKIIKLRSELAKKPRKRKDE